MLTIGEFSKVTSLTIKTIRLYHEKALLPPATVDPATGYRYYDSRSVERAHVITELRHLDFSLAACKEILDSCGEEDDLLGHIEAQRGVIDARLERYRDIQRSLDLVADTIRERRQAAMTTKEAPRVEEKLLGPLVVAGIRGKGRYADSGRRFAELGRALGRRIGGPAMNLYFDAEFREEDADYESAFPVGEGVRVEGVEVREVPGGRFLTLRHHGPYADLGRSYEQLFAAIRDRGLAPLTPSREVYLKGPGMIFRGNPKHYVTEIQVPVG